LASRDELGLINIQTGGVPVSDSELQESLVKKGEYDRVGDGTTPSNAISVRVHDWEGPSRP